MVNTFRSSNPIVPLGTNGTLPALPAAQITPPMLANPQDRTPELLQRTRDSVERGFQAQASVLQTAAEAGQASAANRTQNSFGGVFSSLLSAAGAGFTIYADLEDKKAVRKAEMAKLEAEAQGELLRQQAAAQEAADERLSGQLEFELTEVARDLLEEAGTSTFEQGSIVTRRQFAQSMLQDSDLPPQMQAQLLRMFYEQTNGIQTTLNTRNINQLEEIAAGTLQVNTKLALQDVNQFVVSLLTGNVGSVNVESISQQVDQRLTTFFNENNVNLGDRLHIYGEVLGSVGAAYQTYGVRSGEVFAQRELITQGIERYDAIIRDTQGNTEARNLALQVLGSDLASQGLTGIDWTGIEVTELERVTNQLALNDANRSLQEDQLRNSPEGQEFMSAVALEAAYSIWANPARFAAERRRLENSDSLLDQTTLDLVNLLDTVRTGLNDGYAKIREFPARRAAINVELQRAKDAAGPNSRLGNLILTDTNSGSLLEAVNAELERGRISDATEQSIAVSVREQLDALVREEEAVNRDQVRYSDMLRDTGLSPAALTNYDANMPRIRQRAAEATTQMERIQREREANQAANPRNDPTNFSAGPAVSTPPVVPLATNADGVTWPAAATELDGIRVTSAYGMRTDPLSGTRKFHQGIDIIIPSGNVRTIAGGTVLHASTGNNGGWGQLVTVRTPDGFVEQFNHMDGLRVSAGQIIAPGTIVGRMGSTGRSTGPHLDFRVVRNGTPDDQVLSGAQAVTMNPVDYMRMRGQQTATPLGVGRPPNSPAPSNNNPLSRGQQLWQSLFMTNPVTNTGTQVRGSGTGGATIQNNATPYNQAMASTKRNAYREGLVKNDGEANHGYEFLRKNRDVRVAMHQTASRLGIPSQWLADLIDYETAGSWDAGITNGIGCIGLQFCGGGELDEVAKEFDGNRTMARNHLKNIGLVGQLRYLERYFMRYANGGRDLTSIGALYAGWNGGPSRIRNPQSLPADSNAARRTSGQSSLDYHLIRLGNRTGRRYDLRSSTRGADIGHTHTTAIEGCPICNEQLQKNIFTPHIGDIA